MNLTKITNTLSAGLHIPHQTAVIMLGVLAVCAVALVCWGLQRLYRKTIRWMRRVGSGPVDNAARERIRAALASNWSTWVGLVAMSVSMYNLFRWSHSHLGLPVPMAGGFTLAIDGANVGLILGLYWRSSIANPQEHAIRTIRRMIWALVAVSSAANWAEAPANPLARLAMALIPIIGAGLIELNLAAERAEARARSGEGRADDGVPGPLRLVVVLWQQLWTGIFAWLGLDATATGSERERVMLAQRAARASYKLRLHVARSAELGSEQGRWRRRRTRLRRISLEENQQRAMARAGIASDVDQALAYAREMYLLTQGAVLAGLDYSDPTAVITALEDMRIEVSAERIAAGVQADQSRKLAEEASRSLKEATQRKADLDKAIQDAQSELDAVIGRRDQLAEACTSAQDRAEELLKAADAAHALWTREDEAARAAEAERARVEGLRDEAKRELESLGVLTASARDAERGARERARELLDAANEVNAAAEAARQEVRSARRALDDDRTDFERAREAFESARDELAREQADWASELERTKTELDKHERAREAAVGAIEAAEERTIELSGQIDEAESRLQALGQAHEEAKGKAQAAQELQARIEELSGTLSALEADLESKQGEAVEVLDRHAQVLECRGQVQEALELVQGTSVRLEGLTRAAGALLARLAGEGSAYMAERNSGYVPVLGADGQPVWGKQERARGWQVYWETLTTTGVELDARALATVCGVAEGGRARTWLTDYRTYALKVLNGQLAGLQEELGQAERALPTALRALAGQGTEPTSGVRALDAGEHSLLAAVRAPELADRASEAMATGDAESVRADEDASRALGDGSPESQPGSRADSEADRAVIVSPRAAGRVLAGVGTAGD